MDSFEFNKVAGAVLMTALVATVIGHIGDILVPEPEAGHHLAIAGANANAPAQSQEAKASAQGQSIESLLANADAQDGQSTAKTCQTCHNLAKGQGPKIGPDLWGIVGAKVARLENFQYSEALKKLDGEWSFEKLDQWLTSPQKMASGTKMTFAGVLDAQKRANLIAYLNSQSDKPLPLPKPSGQQASNQPAGNQPPDNATPKAQAQAPTGSQFDALLAKADLEKGQQSVKQCEICHNIAKGKGPKIGPDLWGIVGRKVASEPKFSYSDVLKKLGGEWGFEKLNEWLAAPQTMAPGTKMTFPGVKNEQDRANIIAYLNSQSDKPQPLPK